MLGNFLKVNASPSDAVDTWPCEDMVEVIEDGNILDWRPLIDHVTSDPWGEVAKTWKII